MTNLDDYQAVIRRCVSEINTRYPTNVKTLRSVGISTAVARDGKIEAQFAAGSMDSANNEVRNFHKFRIASISKPITSAAVLLLLQESRLRGGRDFTLNTSAYELLRERFRPVLQPVNDDELGAVTVRDLLHHTSGWNWRKPKKDNPKEYDTFDPMFQDVWNSQQFHHATSKQPPLPVNPEQIIRVNWARHVPRGQYCYSNFNYLLLGRIIEELTNTRYSSYQEFVKREVLHPNKLYAMILGQSQHIAPNESHYFDQRDATSVVSVMGDYRDVPRPLGGFNIENMDSHGGWMASATDLVQFASALFANRIISKPSLDSITAPENLVKSEGSLYGLGWFVARRKEGWSHWHTGLLPGTTSILLHASGVDGSDICWSAIVNTRTHCSDKKLVEQEPILTLIDNAMWAAARALLPGSVP